MILYDLKLHLKHEDQELLLNYTIYRIKIVTKSRVNKDNIITIRKIGKKVSKYLKFIFGPFTLKSIHRNIKIDTPTKSESSLNQRR